MQVYIDIVKSLKGNEKIDKFREVVDYLDLKGSDIGDFAVKCGFMTTEQVSVREVK